MARTKSQKQFERWALPQLKRLQKQLLLEHFEPLEIEYRSKMGDTYAECQFTYPYLSITIRYGDTMLADFQKGDKKGVHSALVHEMCHPLTDPLFDKAISRYVTKDEVNMERERLTDHIANIVLRNMI
jgi:hypothetical protein